MSTSLENNTKGAYKYVEKTNEDFEGVRKQMRVGTKGMVGTRAGEAGGRATLRAQKNGKMDSSSKRKKEVTMEHYCKLGTPTAYETFDADINNEICAWAEAKVEASEGNTVVQNGYGESSQGNK